MGGGGESRLIQINLSGWLHLSAGLYFIYSLKVLHQQHESFVRERVNVRNFAGDKILVTSTDYDWRQVEVKQAVECPECAPNQIKLDSECS